MSYTIDDRDNQSPRNAYAVDTRSNTSTSANGDCAPPAGLCLNLPFSFEHQTITAEAGYRILPQTKVTLNDTFETIYRSYADASFVTSEYRDRQDPQPVDRRRVRFAQLFAPGSLTRNNYANGNTWSLLPAPTLARASPALLMYFEASRQA